MAVNRTPEIGCWYESDLEGTFEVVAYDPDDRTIEIQYFDGAVEEIDMDGWIELAARPTEAPEDWSGSYDIEQEDYGVDLDRHHSDSGDWQNAVDSFE
ncbi:MAG: hypothetical protein D6B27_12185 [Gammaproteobacteria bacterium]|nr:MAG: hypothetical protein D6B27_12185 [Gammaproteobacteria bacterium]